MKPDRVLASYQIWFQYIAESGSQVTFSSPMNVVRSFVLNINLCGSLDASWCQCRCKTLDASADGYVRSEGVVAAILTALSNPCAHAAMGPGAASEPAALALLAATAVNQDGRSSSLTAPNGPSQQAVMRAAHTAAALGPRDVDCLEMHGTGTSLGGVLP